MSPAKRLPRVLLPAIGLAAVIAGACPKAAGAEPVVVVAANRDDDDRDGVPDADDDVVNGDRDRLDLAPLPLDWPPGTTAVTVAAPGAPLRFFLRQGESWTCVGVGGGETTVAVDASDEAPALYAEATAWAGMPATWRGDAAVHVRFERPKGPRVDRDLRVRVAPIRLLPSTAPVDRVYVSTGRYDNAAFVDVLRGLLVPLDVPLVTHVTDDWREMWMQDTMEIAWSATDRGGMHVVLAGLRKADTFPPTLMGPDVAVAAVATPRAMAGGDAWADWYGNLEVSPATAGWPRGRILYGCNRLTGATFHPDVVAVLAAQGAQSPVAIDTSWLLIKHVDEIVAFLPGRDAGVFVLVPDPIEGLRLLGGQDRSGAEADRRRDANARIARAIDAMLRGDDPAAPQGRIAGPDRGGLLAALHLDESRVVRLPVAFDVPGDGLLEGGGVTNASSLWSNPVNALLVNGTLICGASGMPEAVRAVCRERLLAAGADRVEFIDDGVYQKNHGNVHCATNALRLEAAEARRDR